MPTPDASLRHFDFLFLVYACDHVVWKAKDVYCGEHSSCFNLTCFIVSVQFSLQFHGKLLWAFCVVKCCALVQWWTKDKKLHECRALVSCIIMLARVHASNNSINPLIPNDVYRRHKKTLFLFLNDFWTS